MLGKRLELGGSDEIGRAPLPGGIALLDGPRASRERWNLVLGKRKDHRRWSVGKGFYSWDKGLEKLEWQKGFVTGIKDGRNCNGKRDLFLEELE